MRTLEELTKKYQEARRRRKMVLDMYYKKRMTMEQIGKELGLTKQRVHQLIKDAENQKA